MPVADLASLKTRTPSNTLVSATSEHALSTLSARSVSGMLFLLTCYSSAYQTLSRAPHFFNPIARPWHGLGEHQVNDHEGVSLLVFLYDGPAARVLVLLGMRMMWSKDRSGVTWCGIRDPSRRPTPTDMALETLPVPHSRIGLEMSMVAHQSRKDADSSGSSTASLWI